METGNRMTGPRPESRRGIRRRTFARVVGFRGGSLDPDAVVTSLSNEGAYIRTAEAPAVGTRLSLEIRLPTGPARPIRVTARVVRTDATGVGLRFEEIHTRDRTRLGRYVQFYELEDALALFQQATDGALAGNLLPIRDEDEIVRRLSRAERERRPALVFRPGSGESPVRARIEFGERGLLLRDLERPLPETASGVYVAVLEGPQHFVFEGLLLEAGATPRMLLPERLYHNERRATRRRPGDGTFAEIEASHLPGGRLRLPVLDQSEGGLSIQFPRETFVAVGMRLPPFRVEGADGTRTIEGAVVRHVTVAGGDRLSVGLLVGDAAPTRNVFSGMQRRDVRPTFWTNLARAYGVGIARIRGLLAREKEAERTPVHVVQYRNSHGDRVVSLLDATFDLRRDPPRPDVGIVIAPAFLRRKEVFGLLARTLVDNLKALGVHGVVLRFDATHTVGESEVDPELEKAGTPYYRFTFSNLEADMRASLQYLDRRFRPRHHVLVSYSAAAPPARRLVADGGHPPVDLWIVPFGCPDVQDLFRNYLAGLDPVQEYANGKQVEPLLMYGRLADPNPCFGDAIRRRIAFPEDARRDMSRIQCPVTWILGEFDYVVTRERVRQMLDAPGGGLREIFEMPTGHILKSGAEAIAFFKLVAESIARHIFHVERPPVEPDLAAFGRQQEAEWRRVKKTPFTDPTRFWNRHLFGSGTDREGYDVMLRHPGYREFLQQEAELLDPQPGDRVADIGCGTGNLCVTLLDRVRADGNPVRLHCADLVPEALRVTESKIRQRLAQDGNGRPARVELATTLVDLEVTRLAAVRDFLSGRLHGLEALVGRVEGLHAETVRKLTASYGRELHRIVRGQVADARTIRRLCPALDDTEVETVADLSRASRFVLGRTIPEDLLPGRDTATTARDLRLRFLNFGPATQDGRLAYSDASFDRVACSLVLSYVFDPLAVLQEIHRILVPGGVLVVSSMRPNFDASKAYAEEAEATAKRTDLDEAEKTKILDSLREFASLIGCVLELEDEGRFRFFSADELKEMLEETGFGDASVYESFGRPPTAVIVRARKRG